MGIKKIEKQIAKRAFYAALDELRITNDFTVFSALKTEILWRKADFFNAETEGISKDSILDELINLL